ncbi:MAG: CoA pyrophosphatase [Cellulophaga sp.]
MIPINRIKELESDSKTRKNVRKAAVVALFYPDENLKTKLLLILRKTYKGVHSNQIGFPGGKVEDEDFDLKATALRETWEEVGVASEYISLVKTLTSVYIPPSNFEVQPYIGICNRELQFTIQEEEVASLVEVFVTDLMNDENRNTQKMNTSYATEIDVPIFKLNGYTVWGATAMMLNEIKDLLKQLL